MPLRKVPLVNEEIYHVFNRSISLQPVFVDRRDYKRGLNLIKYYCVSNPSVKYSRFLSLSPEEQLVVLQENCGKDKIVDILCYCFMPNHFHFLLKQRMVNGIEDFIKKFEISYSRYFNLKNNRSGPLLQGRFKNVRIENDSQIIHVSRYIHLNPYSSHVVGNIEDLFKYDYSSFREYLSVGNNNIASTKFILGLFKSRSDYRNFVVNHADYQRKLDDIKHLVFD